MALSGPMHHPRRKPGKAIFEKLSIWITLPARSSDFSDGERLLTQDEALNRIASSTHWHLIARADIEQATAAVGGKRGASGILEIGRGQNKFHAILNQRTF